MAIVAVGVIILTWTVLWQAQRRREVARSVLVHCERKASRMADNREKHPFDDESDWCEVCTYFSGEHAEHALTPIQWTVVDHLLGLSSDEPYSDDYLADQIVPAILKAFKEIQP